MLSLDVSDRPAADVGPIRPAHLAPFGTVQTRVDTSGNDHWHLQEIESDEPVDAGTDAALLAAGHPTLTALTPVQVDPDIDLADRLRPR